MNENPHEPLGQYDCWFVGVSRSWMLQRARMEDVRFFHQQANWCYQLAWQSFDLAIAHKLNIMGNAHTAKARELRSAQEPKKRDAGSETRRS